MLSLTVNNDLGKPPARPPSRMASQLAIVHVRADAAIASWLADLLTRALPNDGGITTYLDDGSPHSSRKVLRLSWRQRLPQVVHRIRVEDGVPFGAGLSSPYSISLARLREALDASEASEATATARRSARAFQTLYVDELVNDFAATLGRSLSAIGIRGSSPLLASSMSADGLALLDAHAVRIAGRTSSSAALAALAAAIPMEDFNAMAYALLRANAGRGGNATSSRRGGSQFSHHGRHLPSVLLNRSMLTRRERRRALVDHLARHWPLPRSLAATAATPSTARVMAQIGAPLCDIVPNLASLCSALAGTPHAAAFGDVAANGCRCPLAAAPATNRVGSTGGGGGTGGGAGSTREGAGLRALLIGTHHKTGTVLMEQIMLEVSKSLEGATFHKPSWAACHRATRRPPPPPPPPPKRSPPPPPPLKAADASADDVPTLSSLGLPPPSGPPRSAHAICVDEHVKAVPQAPAWMSAPPSPLVHVIRDPLEVCASSYQYALRANESWLRVPREGLRLPDGRSNLSYQAFYRAVPLSRGLATECRRCLKELNQAATLYERSRREPHTLTIRFEELSTAYDETVRRMLGFLGLASGDAVRGRERFAKLIAATQKHDLSRRAPQAMGARRAGHVSDSSQKADLRRLLLDPAVGVSAELRKLRERMDYAERADEDMARQRRKWAQATMVRATPSSSATTRSRREK